MDSAPEIQRGFRKLVGQAPAQELACVLSRRVTMVTSLSIGRPFLLEWFPPRG